VAAARSSAGDDIKSKDVDVRGDVQASGLTTDGIQVLPLKPPLAHDAIVRMERLDAILGGAGLLEAVKGRLPAKCLEIQLIDLSDITEPTPLTHPMKDVLAYRKTLSEQKAQLQKRENILLSAKNTAYQMLLATCSPNQQQIHNEIVKECNFGVEVHGRYYADGQRAYEDVLRKEVERSRALSEQPHCRTLEIGRS